MIETFAVLFAAFLFDLLIGDPHYPYHPIRILGRCISRLEQILRRIGWEGRAGGCLLVLIAGFLVSSCYIVLYNLFCRLHPWLGVFLNFFLCYSCLALGDLYNHVKPVLRALEAGDLESARPFMAMIVGREVQGLDREGLVRAAVETMAENFVDGFLSPVFWYAAGALLSFLPGTPVPATSVFFMVLFKLASTFDSMVGYKNNKYVHFGWAGARLDDIMNFIPARLSLLVPFSGAAMTGQNPVRGLKTALRDRLKHDSPNAAHPESFVAGALGIRLGGPTRYPEGIKEKPWLGNDNSKMTTHHILKTQTLLQYSAWIAILSLFCLFLFIYYWMTR